MKIIERVARKSTLIADTFFRRSVEITAGGDEENKRAIAHALYWTKESCGSISNNRLATAFGLHQQDVTQLLRRHAVRRFRNESVRALDKEAVRQLEECFKL